MASNKYDIEAGLLGKAIDIAIDAFQKHTPKGFSQSNIDHIVSVYKGFKQDALFPASKYANLSSLKYMLCSPIFRKGEVRQLIISGKKLRKTILAISVKINSEKYSKGKK